MTHFQARTLGALLAISSLAGCASHWQNYLEDHRVEAERLEPETALEALEQVRTAAAEGQRIRAVGAGHSSSDVARPATGQLYVDVRRLSGRLPAWGFYRDDLPEPERFVRVGAGTTIEEINELLAPSEDPPSTEGRALFNMGNYDQQTIAGAFSTGTHGSGLLHGPIADRIVAIEMVTDERDPITGARVQRLLRLERDPKPEGAPEEGELWGVSIPPGELEARRAESTDPSVHVMELEQSSEIFDAALVNLGCFGIIVAVTVETAEPFYLEEVNTAHAWEAGYDPSFLRDLADEHDEFLQLTLVPHVVEAEGQFQGQIMYRQTVRERRPFVAGPAPDRPRSREDLGRILARAFSTGRIEESILADPQRGIRRVRTTFLEQDGQSWTSRSDKVLINSLAPEFAATSIDIQVPFETAAQAIDRIIELAAENGRTAQGRRVHQTWWHTSPLGIRFVGGSRALIAPTYDGPRVSIEIPLLFDRSEGPVTRARHDQYRDRMMHVLETELSCPAYGGRPHWGQRNWMTFERARAMYGDNWTRWVRAYRRFNAFGTFSNSFTERMGLDSEHCGAPTGADCPTSGDDDPLDPETDDEGEGGPADAEPEEGDEGAAQAA